VRQVIYKIIYHPVINFLLLVVNRSLSSLISFRLPPSGIIDIKFENDAKFKMATNQTSFVTHLLYWKGADRFEYSPVFIDLIKSCRTYLDVGADTGYYSLVAASVNANINVHSFEPSSGPLHYLLKNVSLNHFKKRITVHSIALSYSEGEAIFYEVPNHKYNYLKHNLGGVGSLKRDGLKTPVTVKTKTLDQFTFQSKVNHIDLIKIDTEGTENFILQGGSKTIDEFKPIIICETLFNKIEVQLEEIMKKHDYLFFNHRDGKLIQVQTIIREKDNGIRDCFFVHPSKLTLIKDFIA